VQNFVLILGACARHVHTNARQFGERTRTCDSSACIGHSCCVEKNKVSKLKYWKI